jgi:hypothetical protein
VLAHGGGFHAYIRGDTVIIVVPRGDKCWGHARGNRLVSGRLERGDVVAEHRR